MPTGPIDLEAYFDRIHYGGSASASFATLSELHLLHAQAIAFENLSSFAGERVLLDEQLLQHKLVHSGRGGYCFEHNTLFWRVLEQLGFVVSGLAARVLWGAAEGARRARGHMLLRVELEAQSFLADVGFGALTLTAPLQLQADREQVTPHELFRLRHSAGAQPNYRLEAKLPEGWAALYEFDLQAQYAPDFEVWNWWTCTHPRSVFVTELMLARPDAGVRHALHNRHYSRRTLSGVVQTQQMQTLAQLRALIGSAFAIELPVSARLDARLSALLSAER